MLRLPWGLCIPEKFSLNGGGKVESVNYAKSKLSLFDREPGKGGLGQEMMENVSRHLVLDLDDYLGQNQAQFYVEALHE
jgi:hypothetical protein